MTPTSTPQEPPTSTLSSRHFPRRSSDGGQQGREILVQVISFSNRTMSAPLVLIRIWNWLVVVEVYNPMLYLMW
jgi:hypothetical protein